MKHPRADKWLEAQLKPNDIGTAEYRAIHEILESTVNTWDPGDLKRSEACFEHLDAILDEFVEHAQALKVSMAKFRKGKPNA